MMIHSSLGMELKLMCCIHSTHLPSVLMRPILRPAYCDEFGFLDRENLRRKRVLILVATPQFTTDSKTSVQTQACVQSCEILGLEILKGLLLSKQFLFVFSDVSVDHVDR